MQRTRKGWTLALTALGLFMVALDTLVVTTALPVLRVDIGASLSDLEWTVNAYNLAFACFLLTGAALGDRFGRRRMFAVGLAVFTAASAGPVVGGGVIDGLDWHWIFWLNVPIGVALIPLGLARLTESYGPRPQLDLRGLALSAAGLLGLTWGLVRANTVGWGSAEVVATLAAGAALVAVFLAWERRDRGQLLHVRGPVRSPVPDGPVPADRARLLAAAGRDPAPALDGHPDGDRADRRRARRPLRQPALHDPRPDDAGGWAGLGRPDRQARHRLPAARDRAHDRGRRHLALLPHRRECRHGLGPTARGRRRLGDEQLAARAGRRLRGRRPGCCLHPPRRLRIPERVRRRLPARPRRRRRPHGRRHRRRRAGTGTLEAGRRGCARARLRRRSRLTRHYRSRPSRAEGRDRRCGRARRDPKAGSRRGRRSRSRPGKPSRAAPSACRRSAATC